MADFAGISLALQQGRVKTVRELVTSAIDEGVSARDILDKGLLPGMDAVGEGFRSNELYVPDVLVAARAMNAGSELIKPLLAASGERAAGKVVIGTVKGDLHDIGKNLVRMMMEGKGLEVVDLGVDVPAEGFVDAAQESKADVIALSTLLTTTMAEMARVVEVAKARGVRDSVKIMVGGAPVSERFRESIGADCYRPDAASAAVAAAELCRAGT